MRMEKKRNLKRELHERASNAPVSASILLFFLSFFFFSDQQRPFLLVLLFGLQTDEASVIEFLLSTEIIPLCLRIMEAGSELSKTVATFIVQVKRERK